MNGMWYTWVLSTLSQQPERNDNLSKCYTEAYSEHIQTSKMELSTIFVKGSTLDVSLDSECASAYKPLKNYIYRYFYVKAEIRLKIHSC